MKGSSSGDGDKMAQWVKVSAKPGDLNSIPETHRVEGEDSLRPLSSDLSAPCAHTQGK